MAVESINEAKVGDYILFGKYKQGNNYRNVREDLEWLVLAKEDNKILVISKYGLEFKRFHDVTPREFDRKFPGGVTWEQCSLRKFLNEEFINNAFSTAEQNQIISTTVTADVNCKGVPPGNDTIDKIFLLSVNEANKYFSDDSARRCKCTTYCYAQNIYREVQEECVDCDDNVYEACCAGKICGCDEADEGGSWRWWLRTRGSCLEFTAYVVSNGAVSSRGNLTIHYGVVRPAMWISLEPNSSFHIEPISTKPELA